MSVSNVFGFPFVWKKTPKKGSPAKKYLKVIRIRNTFKWTNGLDEKNELVHNYHVDKKAFHFRFYYKKGFLLFLSNQ